jgi:hypothetical protein
MKELTTRIMLGMVMLLLSALVVKDARTASAAESQRGGDPATVIRARAFEVVDERGQVRAQLFLGEDGNGSIRLRDKTGNLRVKLGASTDGYTSLLLFDEATTPAVQLVTSPSDTSLSLKVKGQEKRITPTSK